MDLLPLAIAGLAPAVFWLAWVRSHDRRAPEPRLLVLRAFALGALSTALVVLARPPLEDLLPDGDGLRRALCDAFLVTAPLEEVAKALALCGVLFHRELDEPLDGVVYGAAAGLGFASVENVVYVLREADATLAFTRGFTATLLHLGTTGVLGLLLASARLDRHRRGLAWIALPVAIALHGAYDLFLIAEGGLGWIALVGVLPLVLVVLAFRMREAQRSFSPSRSTSPTAPSGPTESCGGSARNGPERVDSESS